MEKNRPSQEEDEGTMNYSELFPVIAMETCSNISEELMFPKSAKKGLTGQGTNVFRLK